MDQRGDWNQRISTVVVGLVILGAAWWLLSLHWILTVAIAAFIIVAGLLPPLYGNFATAIGWFVLAWIVHQYYVYGWRVPGLLVIVGVFYLGSAVVFAMKQRRVLQGD